MTFPLQFDLLMVGVCTFIQNKKQKKKKKAKKKTKKQKNKKTKNKKKKKKRKKNKIAKIRLCLIFYSIDFFVGFIIGGLSEICMRDELCKSSLRSFVPWIMDDMY